MTRAPKPPESTANLSRRAALLGGGAAMLQLAARPARGATRMGAATQRRVIDMILVAAPGIAPVRGGTMPGTPVWAYGGRVPGPEIRARQGDRLRVLVENRLSEATTVHWHGIRLPNAMDGVPGLTQRAIPPGGRFRYEFDLPDAGTFWYHPHQRSFVQVARGLYGALVVEEAAPSPFARELTWVLGDWRLQEDGKILEDFGNESDVMHEGRIGNFVTINGRTPEALVLRPGERVRLRLVNAASARNFALSFEGHNPWIVALDGQPVTPHEPEDGRIVLGAAMRADIVLDGIGQPGKIYRVVDDFYEHGAYVINAINTADGPRETRAPSPPPPLPGNALAKPDIRSATRVEMVFRGGMEGNDASGAMRHRPLTMEISPDRRGTGGQGTGGHGIGGHGIGREHDARHGSPFLVVRRGKTVVFSLRNETDWHHPMHVHGHSFLVVSHNGKAPRHRQWRDTLLLKPREAAEIAFVADNPGFWMVHCHVLDHQDNGMMAMFRVV